MRLTRVQGAKRRVRQQVGCGALGCGALGNRGHVQRRRRHAGQHGGQTGRRRVAVAVNCRFRGVSGSLYALRCCCAELICPAPQAARSACCAEAIRGGKSTPCVAGRQASRQVNGCAAGRPAAARRSQRRVSPHVAPHPALPAPAPTQAGQRAGSRSWQQGDRGGCAQGWAPLPLRAALPSHNPA